MAAVVAVACCRYIPQQQLRYNRRPRYANGLTDPRARTNEYLTARASGYHHAAAAAAPSCRYRNNDLRSRRRGLLSSRSVSLKHPS